MKAYDYKGVLTESQSSHTRLVLKNLAAIPASSAIEFEIFVKTPDEDAVGSGQIDMDITFYTIYDDSDLTSKVDEMLVSVTDIAAPEKGFKRFLVNQPV
jgi:hypothetical protein